MKILKYSTLFVILIFSGHAFAKERLIFAVDLVRHGDRAPVIEIPKSPIEWKQKPGSLTQQGVEQQKQLGERLRREYVDQLALLPTKYREGQLFVRSTDTERTIGSAEDLLNGLYPSDTRNGLNIPIEVVKRDKDDLLLVKPSGNILSVIKVYFLKKWWWREKTLSIQSKIQHWSEVTGLNLNSFDQLSALADNLFVRQVHHFPLPEGIDPESAQEIISLDEWATVALFRLPEISEPTGRRFLATLKRYFEDVTRNKTSLKYILFSVHDATIMSVLNTLGIKFDTVPEYASRLNFELFESNSRYYVRMSFNGKTLIPSQCQTNDCPLGEFVLK